MNTQSTKRDWFILGETVRGAAHVKNSLPNQDAMGFWQEMDNTAPLIEVVSDGHGNEKCFRCHIGSRYAVQSAIETLKELTQIADFSRSGLQIGNIAERTAPSRILENWRSKAQEHLKEHPFSAEELGKLAVAKGSAAIRKIEENPLIAYGATLLAVLVTDSYILYFQIGDGNITVVDEGGKISRPLKAGSCDYGNETDSLCQDEAASNCRIHVRSTHASVPAVILLSTDGYINSFPDPSGFMEIPANLVRTLDEEGPDGLLTMLHDELVETSRLGSGDDITLGIVGCMSQIKKAGHALRMDAHSHAPRRPESAATQTALPVPLDVLVKREDQAIRPCNELRNRTSTEEAPAKRFGFLQRWPQTNSRDMLKHPTEGKSEDGRAIS